VQTSVAQWNQYLFNRLLLRGGNGDGRLIGGGGLDYLYGESGNDSLSGDAVDQLFGGAGQDLFDGIAENESSLNPKPKKYRDCCCGPATFPVSTFRRNTASCRGLC